MMAGLATGMTTHLFRGLVCRSRKLSGWHPTTSVKQFSAGENGLWLDEVFSCVEPEMISVDSDLYQPHPALVDSCTQIDAQRLVATSSFGYDSAKVFDYLFKLMVR